MFSCDQILFIATGGTIDKQVVGDTLDFTQSSVRNMLKQARFQVPYEVDIIMLIDSLNMDDRHRCKILDVCKRAKERRIVITHGTDTMVETAHSLSLNKESLSNKTICLTGAMLPFVFNHSDALFNLGMASAAVQTLPCGVYIVLNGAIFMANNVKKNKAAGRFEEIKGELK